MPAPALEAAPARKAGASRVIGRPRKPAPAAATPATLTHKLARTQQMLGAVTQEVYSQKALLQAMQRTEAELLDERKFLLRRLAAHIPRGIKRKALPTGPFTNVVFLFF